MLLLSFIRICDAVHRIAQICILNLSAFACFLFWKLTIEIGWEVLKVKFGFWNVLVWQAQTNQLDLPPLEGIIVHSEKIYLLTFCIIVSMCGCGGVMNTRVSFKTSTWWKKKLDFFLTQEKSPAAPQPVLAGWEDRLFPQDVFLDGKSGTWARHPWPMRRRRPWTPCARPWHSNGGEMLCGKPKLRAPFKWKSELKRWI